MENKAKKRVLSAVQLVLLAAVLVCCAWLAWKLIGYAQAANTYNDIKSAYAQETNASASGNDSGQAATLGDSAYVSPIDFEGLQAAYPGCVAWLRMSDCAIDYPIMQATDNDYYLHYDVAGNESVSGSVFLDWRNSANFTDLHTLVYAHNMRDRSMFGQLTDYTSADFYAAGKDTFTIYTPTAEYTYQIFAVNIVDPTDAAYTTGFTDAQVFDGFVQTLAQQSMYDTGVQVTGNDFVVTLSTCSSNNRLILSAKRIYE